MPLDTVQPAPRNPKRHDTTAIKRSIGRFGFTTPALVDERTGRLVVGHGRLEALRAMRADGELPPSGVRVDAGAWSVPVVRGWASRSDAEAEAYLVADNRHTELGGWDDVELGALLAAVGEVDPDLIAVAGYDGAELEKLLGASAGTPAALTDPDDVPGVAAEAYSTLGDVWLLGPHRLMCGDATNPDHLSEVLGELGEPGIVYTDPPYGISIVSGSKVGGDAPFGSRDDLRGTIGAAKVVAATKYKPVAGDEGVQTAVDVFTLFSTTYPAAVQVWWGGNHYVASAGLPDSSCWLVWDKDNTGNFADAELAWTNHPGAVRLLKHTWNGMLRASERGKRVHPTQKPVALAEWAFGVVDPKVERCVVLDAFGGSGSTLIAAHRTNRTAALLELEPAYVDVICRRYQEHTGTKPVNAATGVLHDFTQAS